MILPKANLNKIEKGSFEAIYKKVAELGFTGYLKVFFKKDELMEGNVLLDGGNVLAADLVGLRSKKRIQGDEAMRKLISLESCAVEFYPLTPDQVAKSLEWNKAAEVKIAVATKDKLMLKHGIVAPAKEEINKIVENSVGNSELYLEIKEKEVAKDEVIKKYGVKKPSEEEIDALISNALEMEVEPFKEVDFNSLKKELIQILETKFGRLATKAASIIESSKNYEDLIAKTPELVNSLKTLTLFVPVSRIEEALSDLQQKLGKKLT